GLSGSIEHPCWEGLGVDPLRFIIQDLLHGCHKFFWDHPAKWIASSIGVSELDKRLIAQPKNNLQHFDSGISHLSQTSGVDHRNLQKSVLNAMAGANGASGQVIKTIWSLLDYIYMAQYPLHTDETLQEMATCLDAIHTNKAIFIWNGSRGDADHINTPKFHALPHFLDDMQINGVPINFTANTPESLHIVMCKDPYNKTNRRNFEKQIIWILDIQERVYLHAAYMAWRN
ncbi:hypothetical protein BS47DRAFT_1267423, partial [Hydnum rufescens UP504]